MSLYSTNLQFIIGKDVNCFVENNKNTLFKALLTSFILFVLCIFQAQFKIIQPRHMAI